MRLGPFGLLLFTSFLAGCGGPTDSAQPAGNAKPAAKRQDAALKTYAAADLPAVEEPLPPLDDGTVLLSPPKGWRRLPRDSKYLLRLVKGAEENSLPRITVTAEPAPENMADVTEENAAEFAALMEELSAAVQGRKLLEPERPIVLGDYVWSRHVRQLRARGSKTGLAVVQSLTTARGGRIYTLELTVSAAGESSTDFAAAVRAHRDEAYALAANWKFLGAAAEPAPASGENAADEAPVKELESERNPPADSGEKNPD
jgi:hypothetical protein